MTYTIELISDDTDNTPTIDRIVSFLSHHLDQYRDPVKHIRMAVDYALGKEGKPGGLVVAVRDDEQLVGATVLNKTGMGGYIPENILVYIAVHQSRRGRGIGRLLMQTTMDNTDGDIALHVDEDNPARQMYRKLGFTTPYREMRWKRPGKTP